VTLVDLTPKHIEQALRLNEGASRKLAEARVGDACGLAFPDSSFDMALLMGPLYHLVERPKRILALREARRVVKSGGIIVVAAISRFASLLDGFKYGFVADPLFRQVLDGDLRTGDHVNSSGNPLYFTTSRFHLPEELRSEVTEAGLAVEEVLAVEGFGNCIADIEDNMKEAGYRDYLMQKLRETEAEESMLGASSHLIAIAKKA
jgi:ubiquinone/menaquinone biosynthesis C-methylase UbiE